MWRIPLSDLTYDEAEEQAVIEVLRSRWLSMGPRTEEFEARAAEYLKVGNAVAVANGTCALEMAYQQLISGRGDRSVQPCVVVPDLTFVATANAALSAGARVELTDTSGLTRPVMDVSKVAAIAGEARATGALCIVAPVHYAGFDAGSDEIVSIARSCGALVVEDAAHGIGGQSSSGRPLGTSGEIGCYSFFANKNLATGEGGLVVTDDDEVAAELRLLRSHGMTSLTWKRHSSKGHGYDVLRPGHNYRITEITAALGLVQLGKLDSGNARRRHLYRLYREALRAEPRVKVPFGEGDAAIDRSACHIFPLLFESPALRDHVRLALNEAGIQTSHHYPPVHTFTFYRDYRYRQSGRYDRAAETGDLGNGFPSESEEWNPDLPFPLSVHYAARQMTLPLHPNLKEVEVEEVAGIVLRSVSQFKPGFNRSAHPSDRPPTAP